MPPDTPYDRPGSFLWGAVMQKVLPDGGWTVAKNLGKPCDDFLVYVAGKTAGGPVDGKSPAGIAAAADPAAKFLPAPSCKDAIGLLQIMVGGSLEATGEAAKSLGRFFASENLSAEQKELLRMTTTTESYQAIWKEAKKDAKLLQQTTKLVKFAGSFVDGYLSKIQGEAVDFLLKFEAELLIESIRPRQPLVTSIKQLDDPETNPVTPSRLLEIKFSRSPNDKGVTGDINWFYELYRGRAGAIELVQRKRFRLPDQSVFYDEVPNDGTYVYRVRGVRMVGNPVSKAPDPTWVDKTLSFLGGFVPATVSTVAGQAVIGTGLIQTIGTPLAQIYRGINVQASNFSDAETINVSTQPPTPRPPAALAVHPITGEAFLSIPVFNQIFKISKSGVTPFATPNFAVPNQVGLAIDFRGNLYTDNSASDARFGGRIFSFSGLDGTRTLAGSTNYYSLLIQHANPVSVAAMHIASEGGLSNQLFIADGLNQRVTVMQLPWRNGPGIPAERNISQPYAQSPLFAFGPGTAMALAADQRLAITQNENVLMVAPNGYVVRPLFDAADGAPSPFTQLSGVTFDTYGNMYVSDSVLGTLTMIPKAHIREGMALQGLSTVERKKLTVSRGSRRPTDVKLSGNQRGLVYYDAERALAEVAFGMSGQVTLPGGAPLAGAVVYVPESKRQTTTDGDGVFILPDLMTEGASPVVDFQVRFEGKRHSYRYVLDAYKHNMIDLVFDPPPPPPPSTEEHPFPSEVVLPPVPIPTGGSGTTAVKFVVSVPNVTLPTTCPRGVFLSPAFGAGIEQASVVVSGGLSANGFPIASVIVNGTPVQVSVVAQDFTTTVPLVRGENTMTIALRAAALKPLGCAEASVPDDELVVVSATHRIYQDPDVAQLASYRRSVGLDLGVRGAVEYNGHPLAGITFEVPGTDNTATTDADGVFQINLLKDAALGATAAADTLSSQFFTRIGQIVALLRGEQRAESLAALQSLLDQATSLEDSPPGAAASVETLLARILQVEGTARRIVEALESTDGIPAAEDVDALEALGTQVAGVRSNGEVVVRSREYPSMTVTVQVQP